MFRKQSLGGFPLSCGRLFSGLAPVYWGSTWKVELYPIRQANSNWRLRICEICVPTSACNFKIIQFINLWRVNSRFHNIDRLQVPGREKSAIVKSVHLEQTNDFHSCNRQFLQVWMVRIIQQLRLHSINSISLRSLYQTVISHEIFRDCSHRSGTDDELLKGFHI